jgi:hypothetical protein
MVIKTESSFEKLVGRKSHGCDTGSSARPLPSAVWSTAFGVKARHRIGLRKRRTRMVKKLKR